MKRALYIAMISCALVGAPLIALAQTDTAAANTAAPSASAPLPSTDGIFGCNETGSYAMSVGSLNAVGGTFVPVSDKAVTLNTGYLAYKECVLRLVVDAEAHTLSAAKINQDLQTFLGLNKTSPNYRSPGNPYFVQYYGKEQFQAGNAGANAAFPAIVGALNTAFQSQVQTALARNYAQITQQPQLALTCPYGGDLNSVLNGRTTDVWGGLNAMMNPACSPLSAYTLAQNQLMSNYAAAQNAWQTQMNWGSGIYPITDATGKIVTPAVLLGAITTQSITSGMRQIENANDIGQMVGALFAGMSNRILNSSLGGLANSAPYLAQVQAQESSRLSQSVVNLVASILGPALEVEKQYNKLLSGSSGMAGDLLNATNNLRGAENTCWDLIVKAVCSASSTPAASGGGLTCTARDSSQQLRIATSTEFSQPIIDAQIAPLTAEIATRVAASNAFLDKINALIATYQSASASDFATQAQALVAGFDFNKAGTVQEQANTLHASLFNKASDPPPGLLAQTYQTWVGNTGATDATGNPVNTGWSGSGSTGWCNVPVAGASPTDQQKTTIAAWIARWSH